MKASSKQIAELHTSFTDELKSLCDEMLLYRDKLCKGTLKDVDVRNDHDYKQFGKEAFVWKLKLFIESMEAGDNILEQVKDLINDKYE